MSSWSTSEWQVVDVSYFSEVKSSSVGSLRGLVSVDIWIAARINIILVQPAPLYIYRHWKTRGQSVWELPDGVGGRSQGQWASRKV